MFRILRMKPFINGLNASATPVVAYNIWGESRAPEPLSARTSQL